MYWVISFLIGLLGVVLLAKPDSFFGKEQKGVFVSWFFVRVITRVFASFMVGISMMSFLTAPEKDTRVFDQSRMSGYSATGVLRYMTTVSEEEFSRESLGNLYQVVFPKGIKKVYAVLDARANDRSKVTYRWSVDNQRIREFEGFYEPDITQIPLSMEKDMPLPVGQHQLEIFEKGILIAVVNFKVFG